MPYKDDIWDWSGTDVKVVNATVVLEGVSVITAEPSENAIEPLERADVELLLPIQIISKEEEPTVSQLEIVDFGTTSIECEFEVTTQQADEVVIGILCGTTNPPTFDNADYRLLHGQGVVDITFVGLNNDTEYYLRPYALSNLGYKYGDVIAQRTKSNPIPDEYQLVEYLRGSGESYIDLGHIIKTNGRIYLDMKLSAIQGNSMYGCRDAAEGFSVGVFEWNNSNNYYIQAGRLIAQYIYADRTKITIKNGYLEIKNTNDIVLYTLDGYLFKNSARNAWLFACNENIQKGYGYVYAYKYEEEGVLLRNMLPVYRKSDSKPGMYDIVNKQFYTNQGTGEFIVGPDKEWEE